MGRAVEWSDSSVRTGKMADFQYSASRGWTDRIRIVTRCEGYMLHYAEGRYWNCTMTSMEEKATAPKPCPYCERFGETSLSEKYGCLIIWLYRRRRVDGQLEWEERDVEGKLMFWGFGPDKFGQLRSIQNNTGGMLNKVDLVVELKKDDKRDEEYQDLSIVHVTPSALQTHTARFAKAIADHKTNKDKLYKMFLKTWTAEELLQQEREREGSKKSGGRRGRDASDGADFRPEELESGPGGGAAGGQAAKLTPDPLENPATPPPQISSPPATGGPPSAPPSMGDRDLDAELAGLEREVSGEASPPT